ncbi:hypothetical protein ACFV4N_25810 [Actinosynnema sp. NPDC059797]
MSWRGRSRGGPNGNCAHGIGSGRSGNAHWTPARPGAPVPRPDGSRSCAPRRGTARGYLQIAVLTLAAFDNRVPQARQLGSAFQPPISNVVKWLPTGVAGLSRALGELALLGSSLFVQHVLAELAIIPYYEEPNVTNAGATLASIPFVLLFLAGPVFVLLVEYGPRTWDEEHRRVVQRFRQPGE